MDSINSGLDNLIADDERINYLKTKRVALLVNPTSVDKHLRHIIDLLLERGVKPVRLFGPEHGIRGEAQDMESVATSVDSITGIETKSLYGNHYASLQPTKEDLEDVDILIADIQDIGSRYYTYAYTIGLTMEKCGECGVEVWVVDRPNPLGGTKIEGNIIKPPFFSFVGLQPLPTRHGMTIGELAIFFNRYTTWKCELTVLEMKGWRRSMWFDETGLPWVIPSPNMPTLDTAICYPGQCLLEGTEISEGRGTTKPFEFFGAPYIDAKEFYDALVSYPLEGVLFRPISFRPMFQKYAGETCAGLQLHVFNRHVFSSVLMSYAILQTLHRLYPDDFAWRVKAYEFVDSIPAIDLLLGDSRLKEAIVSGETMASLLSLWEDEDLLVFKERRLSVLIY